jgi:hypothetical protein
MALDPNIALSVKPVEITNPLTQYAQAAQIQSAQNQNRLADLAYTKAQKDISDENALSGLYRSAVSPDGTLDRNTLLTGAASAGLGSKIPALTKSFADSDKSVLEAQKLKIENTLQRFDVGARIMSGVNDQASYDKARQQIAAMFPDQASSLPTVYDPATIEQNRIKALSVKDQLEQHWKQLDYNLRGSTLAETQRHNGATEQTAAGQLAVAQENARNGKNHYDAGSGMIVNTTTGVATPAVGVDGKPIAGNTPKLNEGQANAVAFGARATDAQATLRQLEAAGTTNSGMLKRTAESVPFVGGALGSAANITQSDQQQSYEQAKRNFISAVLRKESGAAIADTEFANEDKKYFPQAGDSAATIAQKARARDLAIEALKAQAGPGASMIPGIITNTNSDTKNAPKAAPAVNADAAMAELRRRAASNPELAKKLAALGQ